MFSVCLLGIQCVQSFSHSPKTVQVNRQLTFNLSVRVSLSEPGCLSLRDDLSRMYPTSHPVAAGISSSPRPSKAVMDNDMDG